MIINGTVYRFTYDANGVPLTMIWGSEIYYYVTNLQGDVIGIKNSNGVQVTTYSYDAWGKMYASSTSPVIMYNPLTYRGYVYDRETGLYYLQSRYYDPEIGRFINADGLVSTGQGLLGNNMFAYCGNNPVLRVDYNGKLWGIIGLAVLIVGVAFALTSSENQSPTLSQQAKEKYNQDTVAVYERDNPPDTGGIINAEIYYPSNSTSNISIERSLDITSPYEQDAILDVIVESPYYSEEIYGSKSFMQAQWVAHNASYDIASSGAIGFWIMQQVSGSDNPILSSNSLDLRSLNNLLKRQKIVYTIISWAY